MSGADEQARGSIAVVTAVACVLVVGVFGGVVTHPFVAFDDAELILRNPEVIEPFGSWIDQLRTPHVGYPVPVTVGLEAALFALSGGRAWAFHAASLLLHALFVAQLLRHACRSGARPALALAGMLVFAVHPLVVQPVAWATCLKDLLMANLVWAATTRWLALVEPPPLAAPALARRGGLVVVLALAAMLAKPSAALVGFAWLAVLGARRLARSPASFGALVASMIVSLLGVALGFVSRSAHDAVMGVEPAQGGSSTLAFAVLGRQLVHVVWPDGLRILYAVPDVGFADSYAWIGLVAVGALAVLGIMLRARPHALLLFALAVTIYLPTSNVLAFARVMSDSYMYLPLALICLGATLALERRLARLDARRGRTLVVAAVPLVGLLAGLSYAELERWRGGEALWQPVVEASPGLAQAHRLLGDELVFRGEPERAVEPYRRAFVLDYDPRFLDEFGSLLAMAGRLEDAECVLVEAFAYGSDPADAAYNYAVLLAFHPGYRVREPGAAGAILARVEALVRAGRLRFPRALEPGLATQRERLARAAQPPPTWRKRTCSILRAE